MSVSTGGERIIMNYSVVVVPFLGLKAELGPGASAPFYDFSQTTFLTVKNGAIVLVPTMNFDYKIMPTNVRVVNLNELRVNGQSRFFDQGNSGIFLTLLNYPVFLIPKSNVVLKLEKV